MRWALNTPAAFTLDELEDGLVKELDEHAATAPNIAARFILSLASSEDKQDPIRFGSLHARAEAAKADVIAQLPAVQKQMRAGIAAACAIAGQMSGGTALYRATIMGHLEPDHIEGITERLQVFVDIAKPPNEPEKDAG